MRKAKLKRRINPRSLANLIAPKKGEIRNPKGAGAAGGALMRIRRLGSKEVAEIGEFILNTNVSALNEIIEEAKGEDGKGNPDSKHSALKVWMATIAYKGITKGDPYAMDALLNRIVGKVSQELIIDLPPTEAPKAIDPLEREQRQEKIAKYQKMLSEVKDVECTVTDAIVLPPEESNQ